MSEICKNLNDQQLLKHIVRVFPTCYVEIGFSWVRPLASQPFNYASQNSELPYLPEYMSQFQH